jgi:hypothetical protein
MQPNRIGGVVGKRARLEVVSSTSDWVKSKTKLRLSAYLIQLIYQFVSLNFDVFSKQHIAKCFFYSSLPPSVFFATVHRLLL